MDAFKPFPKYLQIIKKNFEFEFVLIDHHNLTIELFLFNSGETVLKKVCCPLNVGPEFKTTGQNLNQKEILNITFGVFKLLFGVDLTL